MLTKDEDGVLLLPDVGINSYLDLLLFFYIYIYIDKLTTVHTHLILQLAGTATNGVAFIVKWM